MSCFHGVGGDSEELLGATHQAQAGNQTQVKLSVQHIASDVPEGILENSDRGLHGAAEGGRPPRAHTARPSSGNSWKALSHVRFLLEFLAVEETEEARLSGFSLCDTGYVETAPLSCRRMLCGF